MAAAQDAGCQYPDVAIDGRAGRKVMFRHRLPSDRATVPGRRVCLSAV